MSSPKFCTRCAAELPEDSLGMSVCTACEAETENTMAEPADFQLPPTPIPAPVRTTSGPLLPPAAPLVSSVGDFEVLDKLGQGGMGAVYRARQTSLGRLVALKVLPQQFEAEEDYVARFQREAMMAARLNHPNLVRVYSSGEAEGCHYIAMELVEGENLRQRMKREPLTMGESLAICADVARALQCGWDAAQLIHRDVKPANIYLSHSGQVKLGDLGLAKSALANTTGITQTGTSLGTPLYMSPEQGRGDKLLDFRSDIYSLGCMLYEMLTGKPPYEGRDGHTLIHQHIHAPLPAILKVLPGCPLPVARLVGRMLKKHPRERHADYASLLTEIEQVREQIESGVSASGASALVQAWKEVGDASYPAATPRAPNRETPPALSGQSQAPRTANPLKWAGIAAVIAVLGTGAYLLARPKAPKARPGAPTATAASVSIAERRTSAVRVPPAPPASAPQWQRVVWDDEHLSHFGARRTDDDGIVVTKFLPIQNLKSRHVVIRAEIRQEPDTPRFLTMRLREERDRGARTLAVSGSGTILQIASGANRYTTIASLPHTTPLKPDEWMPVRFATVGTRSLGSFRGAPIPVGESGEMLDAGGVAFSGNGRVRNVEVLVLDDLPDAEALRIAEREVSAPSAIPISQPAASQPKWIRPFPDLAAIPQAAGAKDGWVRFKPDVVSLVVRNTDHKAPEFRNGGVRARLRPADPAKPKFAVLQLRRGKGTVELYFYHPRANGEPGKLAIRRYDLAIRQSQLLGLVDIPEDRYRNPSEYTLEFLTIERKLIARFNGRTELTAQLPSEIEINVGGVGLYQPHQSEIRDIEMIDLDGVPEAEAMKLAGQDASVQSGALVVGDSRYELVDEKLSWTDAKARAEALGGRLAVFETEAEERAVRDLLRNVTPEKLYWIGGHAEQSSREVRWIDGQTVEKAGWISGNPGWRLNQSVAVVQELGTLFAAGMAITAGRNGEGWLVVAPLDKKQQGFLLERRETGNVASGPNTASKDAPFVNSLGMKFVPVSISGGPTSGKQVLFSVWETRVQDYAPYEKETDRKLPHPGFEQGPAHPIVRVSWDDATAFCEWLTKKERASNSIPSNQMYRLPTDHEWSCAAGIGAQEDASRPIWQKSHAHSNPTYPWGSNWPPPPGAGNYAGEEMRSEVEAGGWGPTKRTLDGYRDDFIGVAPVGSFLPNAAALFDLSGNVWEWCVDRYEKEKPNRVIRGGAWDNKENVNLATTRRNFRPPETGESFIGFRPVLAPVE